MHPYQWTSPKFDDTKQLKNPLDTTPPIPDERNCRIQKIVVTFLYYSIDVNCTILRALNTIAEQQANPNHNTEDVITNFLYYAATNPSTIVQYKAINMMLHIYRDASYLS